MRKVSRQDLMSLERYYIERPALRQRVIAHKNLRQVLIGPHVSLSFEDFTTICYQIQEMLRVERIFETEAIDDELRAYNPLIPDGDNWKATMMIEYEDVDERRHALATLRGVEDRVWFRVAARNKIFAVADEDMDRSRDDKTAAVHFLRFTLDDDSIAAVKAGAAVTMGIDHPAYVYETLVSARTAEALRGDLA